MTMLAARFDRISTTLSRTFLWTAREPATVWRWAKMPASSPALGLLHVGIGEDDAGALAAEPPG
jgi:hypothetical protein